MKKILLLLIALHTVCQAETIRIKDCTVPHVRYNQLFYHAADGRIIFGYDDKINTTPVKDPSYDGFVRMNAQKSYTLNQDGLDCVINTSDPIAPTGVPAGRTFGIK